jgi:hypothetical protein
LENLCQRKQATDEKAKFAWLVKTVNTSDKRMIMKYKTDSIVIRRKVEVDGSAVWQDIIIYGRDHPYTWAVETLRKLFAHGNANDEEKVFELREAAKDRIKAIRIADCSYSLDEFYKRFDRSVVTALNIGCELSEQYLIKLFAQGCAEHKDLSSRASIIHLESKEDIKNYTDLKILYDTLIVMLTSLEKWESLIILGRVKRKLETKANVIIAKREDILYTTVQKR